MSSGTTYEPDTADRQLQDNDRYDGDTFDEKEQESLPRVVSHVIVIFGFPESEKAEKSEVAHSGCPARAVRRLLDNDLLRIGILLFIHIRRRISQGSLPLKQGYLHFQVALLDSLCELEQLFHDL